MSERAMRAGALLSPRSNLEAASRPLALISDFSLLWHPQRIFTRVAVQAIDSRPH